LLLADRGKGGRCGHLRSADQLAQSVSLTAPGIPIIVEFAADQLANLEQPVDLRLYQGCFSLFHDPCVSFHRNGSGALRHKGKYAVKLGGIDLVVAGVGPGH
jgi:hypothetical protein